MCELVLSTHQEKENNKCHISSSSTLLLQQLLDDLQHCFQRLQLKDCCVQGRAISIPNNTHTDNTTETLTCVNMYFLNIAMAAYYIVHAILKMGKHKTSEIVFTKKHLCSHTHYHSKNNGFILCTLSSHT